MAVIAILSIFGIPAAVIYSFLQMRHQRQMRELDVRELEAKAKLAKSTPELPAYIDPNDSEAVAAFVQAKREVEIASAQLAARAL